MSRASSQAKLEPVEGDHERTEFIAAMRRAVSGVNVVTSDGPVGRFGLTVSAFSSVSADPPTVLVCINQKSPLRVAILANQRFCVNVLASEHKGIAESFSGLSKEGKPYQFDPSSWTEGATGSPLLVDALASFDCTLDFAAPSGSHAIFVGRVIAVNGRSGTPLLYTNRTYGRPTRLGV